MNVKPSNPTISPDFINVNDRDILFRINIRIILIFATLWHIYHMHCGIFFLFCKIFYNYSLGKETEIINKFIKYGQDSVYARLLHATM